MPDAAAPDVSVTAAAGGEAFASTGDGKLTVAAEKDGKLDVVQTVSTAVGARTMGMDAEAHRIYLAASDVEPAATAGGRPKVKPGTFKILVVAPQ